MLSPLSLGLRLQLFSQLAAMEKAGLPIDQALGLVRLSAAAQPRLDAMCQSIRLGCSVADAGESNGLFNALETSLIKAASNAGKVHHAYRRLADQYSRRAAQLSAIRSRMMLPFATLVIGSLVSPLPKLIAGTLSPAGYSLRCLLELSLLAGAGCLLFEMPRLRPRPIAFDRLASRLPLFGVMQERRNIRDFFESLALLIEAGMPILQALPIANDTIRDDRLRMRFGRIKSRIEQGASFSMALSELRLAGKTASFELIRIGEAGGALPDMLFRCADSEAEAIHRFDQSLAEWLPRIVYLLIALLIAYNIMGSRAFGPSLPPGLN